MGRKQLTHVCLCLIVFTNFIWSATSDNKDNTAQKDNTEAKIDQKWKKKDVRDYTDADIERLFDQWEDNDEDELEPDELPEHKRPQPSIDLSNLDKTDPENILQASKKGRTLMMFVSVSGNPTEKETEKITQLWQSSLYNAHLEVQRYVVGADRVLFVLKDGSKAWEIKDFLVKQERCKSVTIEGKDYSGEGAKEGTTDENKPAEKSQKNKSKPKKKGSRKDKKKDEL